MTPGQDEPRQLQKIGEWCIQVFSEPILNLSIRRCSENLPCSLDCKEKTNARPINVSNLEILDLGRNPSIISRYHVLPKTVQDELLSWSAPTQHKSDNDNEVLSNKFKDEHKYESPCSTSSVEPKEQITEPKPLRLNALESTVKEMYLIEILEEKRKASAHEVAGLLGFDEKTAQRYLLQLRQKGTLVVSQGSQYTYSLNSERKEEVVEVRCLLRDLRMVLSRIERLVHIGVI